MVGSHTPRFLIAPKPFFLLHFLAIALNLSLFLPPTSALWLSLDTWIFRALNTSIVDHPMQQIFWAVGNIRTTDIFGALFLVSAFLVYIFESTGVERKRRVGQLLYAILWFEISIFCCKQLVTPLCEGNELVRHGPTVVLPNCFMISQVIPWTKVKDSSYFCYPADHAAIVFQWCTFLWFFAGWKRGLFLFLASTLFILPRLIAGGHWPSDLLVGSSSIVMAAMAWATCTAIYPLVLGRLYAFIDFISKRIRHGRETS